MDVTQQKPPTLYEIFVEARIQPLVAVPSAPQPGQLASRPTDSLTLPTLADIRQLVAERAAGGAR